MRQERKSNMPEQINLKTGDHLTAKIDRPWYATQGMVRSKLEELGFANIEFQDTDPETITGDYNGAPKSFDKPSQIISYSIWSTASTSPTTQTSPGLSEPLGTSRDLSEPLPSIDLSKTAAFQTLKTPALGAAILLDVLLFFGIKKLFSSGKKAR